MPRSRSRRTGVLRTLAASGGAAALGLMPLLAAHASTASARLHTSPPVTIAITSMNPDYAAPGKTITVAGFVRDNSRAAVSHLSVGLEYSRSALGSRGQVAGFASGAGDVPQQQVGRSVSIARLRSGVTRWWRIRLPASSLRLNCFGVYPLSAQVTGEQGTPLGPADPTVLPYWPASAAACPGQSRPAPEDISWVWPLIGTPDQAACPLSDPSHPHLLDNGLAASLGRRGRLAGLLTAGLRYAARARLTWALDPALLASAQLMASPYQAGGGASCGPAASYPASKAAKDWLTSLIRGTARQPVFVTPYADTDVAALASSGLSDDLTRAFTQGRAVAGAILRRKFDPAASGGGTQQLLDSLDWPADGVADYAVLENLAAVDQIRSVILDSATMPPDPAVYYTPSAVTSTPDGYDYGGEMRVLLSDDQLTQLLGSAQASSPQPADAFWVQQLYLGETAMIAAEAPAISRAVVVAPPRRWAPSAGLAGNLLAATVSAPWLRPTSAAALLASQPGQGAVTRQPPTSTSPAALGSRLLRQVGSLDQQLQLLAHLGVPGAVTVQRDQLLDRAVFTIESSAWRGTARSQSQAAALLQGTAHYVRAQLAQLTVISNRRVTLGGLGGNVFLSIDNGLGFPVRVRLVVSRLTNAALTTGPGSISVPGGGIVELASGQVKTVKIKVDAVNAGTTSLRVSVRSGNGVPLPGGSVTVKVTATHFGRLALIIGAVALAIFMITSATRAIRRDPPGSDDPRPGDADASGGDGTGAEADASLDSGSGASGGSDVPGGADRAARTAGLESARLSAS